MGRLEKFREKRIRRNMLLSAVALFFLILLAGLAAVDYSTNFLMNGSRGIAFTSLSKKQDSIEIVLMNNKIHINTRYISRDMETLKNKLRDLF